MLDVVTAEVVNGTGFYSLATNFSHLVASLAANVCCLKFENGVYAPEILTSFQK